MKYVTNKSNDIKEMERLKILANDEILKITKDKGISIVLGKKEEIPMTPLVKKYTKAKKRNDFIDGIDHNMKSGKLKEYTNIMLDDNKESLQNIPNRKSNRAELTETIIKNTKEAIVNDNQIIEKMYVYNYLLHDQNKTTIINITIILHIHIVKLYKYKIYFI